MNYPLKIMLILDDFPPINYTSAGKVFYSLAKEFKSRGHKLFIITSVQKKEQEGTERREGLKIFRIYSNYHPRWQAWLSLYNPQTVSRVEKIMREVKPDVVNFRHIHWHLSYYCFKIAKKYSKAVFLTAINALLISYGKVLSKNGKSIYKLTAWENIKEARKRYNPFRNIIIRYYLKYVDKIFTISNAVKEFLNINGIKNTITIYNGINVDEWQEKKVKIDKFKKKYNLKNKKVVLFGGRLSKAKGGEAILRAMKKVIKKIDNAVLLVTGKKEGYAKEMMDIAKKLGIENKVIFTGFLRGDEIKSVYHSADVCTLPSIYLEAFGMTGLEVMAAGRPLIGSCFGGIPEMIIDGKTGYVVNPLDVETMADRIIDLLKNHKKAERFGKAARERARTEFSLKRKADETLEQYYNFLNKNKAKKILKARVVN